MDGFMKHKIMQNLVLLGKRLNLNDRFQKLSVQKKIFFQRILDDILKGESPAFNYCMMLISRGQNILLLKFIQFVLIKLY